MDRIVWQVKRAGSAVKFELRAATAILGFLKGGE
jgi:hypothetical protein